MDEFPGHDPRSLRPGEPVPPTRFQHVVIWIVFAAICVMFIVQHQSQKETAAAKGPKSKLCRPPSLDLLLEAKVIVGAKAWADVYTGLDSVTEHYDDTVRRMVKNETDRLCLVPLFAELYDRDRAVSELNAITLPNDCPDQLREVVEGFHRIYVSDAELSTAAVAKIRSRLGWFGDLAVSHAAGRKAENDAIVSAAKQLAVVQVCVMLLIFTGVILGIVLIVTFVVRQMRQRWQNHFDPAPPNISQVRIMFLELAVIGVASILIVPTVCAYALAFVGVKLGTQLSFLFILPIFAVFSWPLLRQFDWAATRKVLGMTSGRGVAKEVGFGFLGYLAGAPLIAFCALISKMLAKQFGKDPSHPIVETIRNGNGLTVASTIFLACVIVPILEEGIFRGALYAYLRRHTHALASGAISAFIFAAIHPQGWTAIPTLCAIGFTLAMIREWRGSLIASIVAHALNNGFALGLLCIFLLS